MKAIKSLAQFEAAKVKAEKMRFQAYALEKAVADFRLQTLRKVEFKPHRTKEYVCTLCYNGRVFTVEGGGAYCTVFEQGKGKKKKIKGNVHDVRFLIALGEI